MLVTVIQAKNYDDAYAQMMRVAGQSCAFELRLDTWEILNFEAVAKLRARFSQYFIFTLRRFDQGGFYLGSEVERLTDILRLCACGPDCLDLEYDVDAEFVVHLAQNYPDIQLMASFHDFDKTPDDLDLVLARMQAPYFAFYKIAGFARSSVDALRMLVFVRQHKNVTGLCMGELGECTRILGLVVGNVFDYACVVDEFANAPGQLSLQTLLETFHYQHLNQDTKIYAVLGDPVNKSSGIFVHNQTIRFLDVNAVYVRLCVKLQELALVISLCRQLPFLGCSVTMPLKEMIIPLLDEVDPNASQIKAVNTVVVRDGRWCGFNTDGIGAVRALARFMPLAQQKIVILGAGGAARAITFMALQAGAQVSILNRTLARAEALAKELGCEAFGLDKIKDLKTMAYTTIVNTLPLSMTDDGAMQKLIGVGDFIPGTLAMDIIAKPISTEFLKIAQSAVCQCVFGYEMYIGQALKQIEYWFYPDVEQMLRVEQSMRDFFLC